MVMAILPFLGRRLSTPAIDLDFPFRSGTFIIAQGGSNTMVNIHAANSSQRYGLDIVKLNSAGTRARGLYPADLKRYAIFGEELICPCDGIVAAVQDNHKDFSPPDRDIDHRAGNYIAIEYKGATLYLAHLMKGSICVPIGEHVHSGQTLGRVGNSGNTTEPHLHVHAEKGSYPGTFSGNQGIPILFNHRYLIRNDRITVENE